ncbi:hypothetical protein [Evansella cellulosilytica]|uniref:CcmD family protein n=1 Tax=Evansella cellulosilytica (strain ATCC 21833 / DSM 2522 / FERM P-1141 / JCM 9156 / N-4) TaxID=649639 RepID=E6TWI4_EVAC2|nr:hypothetical protein [Evansella cellulosilytica]ADU32247.1 hypothetical protein Bcell_4016 [Evansella cellulosilytica DSM 2522]
MFEDINVFNVIYQFIAIAAWLGIILLIITIIRSSIENRKRLERLEEKVDYIKNKIDN